MGLFINGFKRPRRVSSYYIPPFWGDGSDGILTAGAIYHAGVDFEKYSGFCIKQFSSINWGPETAETLTVDEPCRGLILLVSGDVNIGATATISMAKMGSILPANPSEIIGLYGDSTQMRYIVETLKTLRGGAGGDGGDGEGTNPGSGGAGGVGRICQGGNGGGGGGAHHSASGGGNGGNVNDSEACGFSGGANDSDSPNYAYDGINGGGGGGSITISSSVTNAYAYSGGAALGAGGGGGGAYGATAGKGKNGEYTGGFILIIARGSVTITGRLDVTGGDGGAGGGGSYDGGGGGGSGGGVIAVFAKGYIDTSSATKTLTGGTGGTGYQNGTVGGNGLYYEERI